MVTLPREANKKSQKLFPFVKMVDKHGDVFFHHTEKLFNPIALRKAKIGYNFGLSECNRVNSAKNVSL